MQETIATWYLALRQIALVGLLSVLVYVGIRIVTGSASPQGKSKYKNMLKDWLVAICLLFTLHYIMSLTLTVVQDVTEVFATNGDSDELLNTLREDIFQGETWGEVLGSVLMYITLVIYTISFTIQYIKRVIYMAFFTLIAPLITLTYPLDKIKDGQAQAFNMWIREYVFNALIQVVHLILYTFLVSSAMELVGNYWLYAIIVIGFMTQAEKIIRKMFGFENTETVGSLGAAATGGLIMKAMNKIKKPSEKSKSSSNSPGTNGPRMANTPTTANTAGGTATAGTTTQPTGGTTTGGTTIPPTAGIATAGTGTAGTSGAGSAGGSSTTGGTFKKTITGVGKLAKKYTRPVVKKAVGIGTGLAGAAIGVASGIAQGDAKAAFTGFTGGALAGYHGGQRAVDFVADKPKEIKDIAKDIIDTFK